MRSSYTFMRIRGIRISVHFTWLFAVAFIALTLSEGFFPAYFSGWSIATYWGTGVLASLLLFLSVLVHELAHSFVAQARGLKVEGITLFIFGGVSNMGSEATRARDEFVIAVVGPLTSLVLAALFWALYLATGDGDSPVVAVLFYLGYMNALLAVFNMIPIPPLDGGRGAVGLLPDALAFPLARLERAIGVIYRPATELQSHYFPAALADQFDEWIWIDETRALTPLGKAEAPDLPRAHPFRLLAD